MTRSSAIPMTYSALPVLRGGSAIAYFPAAATNFRNTARRKLD